MKQDDDVTASTRRTITPAEIDAQRRGSTRIAPGIWQDADGAVHFSVPELLALVDLEDTPANRDQVAQTIAHIWPGPIIRQDPES